MGGVDLAWVCMSSGDTLGSFLLVLSQTICFSTYSRDAIYTPLKIIAYPLVNIPNSMEHHNF